MPLPKDYPPHLEEDQLASLRKLAIDWALAHGLVMRPKADVALPQNASVIHAPVTLFPSPVPRRAFEEVVALQPLFNRLYLRLSLDHTFITEIVSELSDDEFITRLYKIYLEVRKDGVVQPISLGLQRSDYLLHAVEDEAEPHLLQVEFNTIAASFSSLSTLTGDLHRYLIEATGYFNTSDLIKPEALPLNESMTSLAKGLARAHELYGVPNAVIVMIVQPLERNAFDQRWLEYHLLRDHKVKLISKELQEIADQATVDQETKALIIANKEASVVYLRAGYGPEDYHSEKEWNARLLIERSRAIKCPTTAYQLVGSKKFQQVLTNKGVLERFVQDAAEAAQLRAFFTGLYPLDSTPEGEAAAKLAMEHPERFVMKPQREGGGNNKYTHDIRPFLSSISASERSSYILMDLIRPPQFNNIAVQEGRLVEGKMISELGIYGVILADADKEIVNEAAGHLIRTKGAHVNEGGVATGFAVLDSPLLV